MIDPTITRYPRERVATLWLAVLALLSGVHMVLSTPSADSASDSQWRRPTVFLPLGAQARQGPALVQAAVRGATAVPDPGRDGPPPLAAVFDGAILPPTQSGRRTHAAGSSTRRSAHPGLRYRARAPPILG